MKQFVVLSVVAFLTFSNVAMADKSSDSSSAEENIKELAEALNEKFNSTLLIDAIRMAEKAKEKCPNIEEKIETTMEKVGECLEDIELGSETFCSLIKKNFVKCSKPARDLITTCLPDESKELPAMGEKVIMAIINQACASTVEEILELLNPCVLEKDPGTFPVCKEVKTTLDEHKNKLPSKSLICSTIPKVRTCAKAVQEASCTNSVTKASLDKFHDAIDNAIKADCAAA